MNLIRKYLISKKLKKLAKVASRRVDLVEELSGSSSAKSLALEDYFLTAIELDDIHELTLEFRLNIESFEKIYADLLRLGLGQWVNGSYIALATLSNSETLGFYLVAKQSDIEESGIIETLYCYWSGEIKKGSLQQLLRT
ncbi:hypothetical protein Q6U65_004506 [Vibrio parahaemolyticus]|nr:hypothetical protein [Vibrio parahaemolyticus]